MPILARGTRRVIIGAMKKALKTLMVIGFIVAVWKVGAVLFSQKITLDFSGEKVIDVNDNGFHFLVSAKAATVDEFLQQQEVEIGSHDFLFPERDTKLIPGMEVSIARAVPVAIAVDGQEIRHHTFKGTVEEALREAGVTLSHLDKTSPQKEEAIEKDLEIVVTRINVEEVVETESIEFGTIEKQDKKLKWRKEEIEQEGIAGTKEVKYEITYKDGKQVSKEKLSTKIIEEATDKIVRIGTKVEVGKSKVGIASWYAHTGTMACASRMFPRGTWLRVTNRENGKQVFVVVNDYGPQRGTGKMIDLDSVAFKKLASLGKGVIEVKVEEILE